MFTIRLGVPEMREFWNKLKNKVTSGKSGKDEQRLYRKIGKAMKLLSGNPKHPGLESHCVNALSNRYGKKVWESYLENNTPAAGRMFWIYGPEQGEITIIGLEPHPNDKGTAYDRVTLSSAGK
ncbi:MAG: hypothetical protein IK055_08765 [Lachnospiraceae bacterium]|nr:hypothetical protein [Lachnospiraceae bacterium]